MVRERRPSILVVDDEQDVVQSVTDLLRLDYRVLGATRARDGISILGQEPVDVVMTDQRMPDMTGVELLHQVRETHPNVTRLLFTGYADIRAVVDAINEGNVYRYITKPWEASELQSIIRDAVERHELIADRQRLLAELQRKNDELTRANAELADASALKSNFIQVASHELRTPLAILLTASYLAANTQVDEPLRGWLGSIESASGRLDRLVDQLTTMLAVGRFERPLVLESMPLATLLQQAAEDVQPFITRRRQRFVCEFDDELGTVVVEPSKVRDCLNHLLLNALKFTPDGGRITLGARRMDDGGVEIRVSDTGTGMNEATLRRVFEPFFTAFDVSRHSSGVFEFGRRGVGLGLAVVKAFVEMHGGHVTVESEIGRGSTFVITLPATPATSAAQPIETGW